MTGNPIPQFGMGSTVDDGSGQYLLEKLNNLSTDLGFSAYTSGEKTVADVLAITLALMVGTAGLPHVIVRFFTVKRMRDARKSVGLALLFIALLYATAPAIAVFAKTNLIETVSNKPYSEMPGWFKNWENTGLIKFNDKNNDGLIQYQASKNINELEIDNDIMVLANPEIADLPAWVIALVAAGGLAAALSTAAGLLLVISTSVSNDLVKKIINPSISEKSELWTARISASFAVLIAGYFGINPPDFVAAVVALAFGLAAASLFPAIVLGIFFKRINKQGAISGMLAGISLMLFYMMKYKLGWLGEMPDKSEWWFGISPEGFGTIAMCVNFIVSIIVSYLTSKPPKEIYEMVETIRVPESIK
jgi:cation/acetate symporter